MISAQLRKHRGVNIKDKRVAHQRLTARLSPTSISEQGKDINMATHQIWQQGDKVSYVGEKFKGALHTKEGYVVARVEGEANGYVVEFPEMKSGESDYILPGHVLGTYRASKNEVRQEKHDVKVEQRRAKTKRNSEEQE